MELDQVDHLPKEKGKIRVVQLVANNNNNNSNTNNNSSTSAPNPSETEEAEEPDDPNDPSNELSYSFILWLIDWLIDCSIILLFLEYDIFLSHRQKTGADLAQSLKLQLELLCPGKVLDTYSTSPIIGKKKKFSHCFFFPALV